MGMDPREKEGGGEETGRKGERGKWSYILISERKINKKENESIGTRN